jgi:predicted  nucleic acid-binding Zn ribbon protein
MDLDKARICQQCQSGDDVKLMQPVRDGLMFRCVSCKRIWTVLFARESQPMFPPEPRL